jgi:uncharacterized protein (TIGR00661 family)
MVDFRKHKPRVMVCPLNWGLGHASRCIPIIRMLKEAGFEVIIAAEGRALSLLKEELNDIDAIIFKGFSPRFPSEKNIILKVPVWLISLAWYTLKEHYALPKLVKEYDIDIVISDNRYGLFTKKAKCIFITHQVMIKIPRCFKFAETLLYQINRYFIQKFDSCWIPDLPGPENLSGDLSHKYPLPVNTNFIGLLSRFRSGPESGATDSGNILALLSGPEPQRTIFEKLLLDQFKKTNHPATIIQGKPSVNFNNESIENVSILNHLRIEDLSFNIKNAGIVICRSGYSTLMDMAVLGKKEVLLVPTPGQTEQEYLAERLRKLGWMNFQTQNVFNLDHAVNDIEAYNGILLQSDESLLNIQIKALIQSLNLPSASH